MHDDDLDPLLLDRSLRQAAKRWVRWRRRLRSAEDDGSEPFETHRAVTGQTLFQRLEDLGERDPLLPHLRRWVYRLAEQRINAPLLFEIAFERRARPYVIDRPEHTQTTLADMFARSLSDAPRRAEWLETFSENAPSLAVNVGILWERRTEIARRMGNVELDALELCNAEIAGVAASWLNDTQDMADAFKQPDLASYLEMSLGADFVEGWPRRLGVSSLADLFRGTRLLDGLPLDPGAFPTAIAGSSFLRGLLRLGAAWASAAAPAHQPFVVAHDPYGLGRRTFGATFAGLAASTAFSRHALGLSAPRARERLRAVARIMMLHVRTEAARVVLRAPALAGRSAFTQSFEETAERLFGCGQRSTLAGALLPPHEDDAQRFAGALLAAERTLQLVNDHDEDWFRNPRAIDQLRSEANLSPEITVPRVTLESGAGTLARFFREALD